MISINVQNDTLGFTGDTVVEYGVGCADIDDVLTPPPTSAVLVNEGGKNPILIELLTDRFTLDWWKCYLDSCATYHTFFIKEFPAGVHKGETTINGSCNAGTVSTNTKGWYGDFQIWLNKKGIANLLSIPMLEEEGYIVSTHTKSDWVVTTPKEKKIVFKRDTGICNQMPYIDLRKNMEGFTMVETIRK